VVVKNIQVFDGAENAVYDIFAASDEVFALLFLPGTDIAFIEEIEQRAHPNELFEALTMLWRRRVPKAQAMGIHGLLFYQMSYKRKYYPTLRDEEAINPDGTRLRMD
jgi:hypothetical protein